MRAGKWCITFCVKMKKHEEISTYFCLKHRCGKKSAIFPYSVSSQKPRDYPPWFMSRMNFVLSWVEHGKSFITLGLVWGFAARTYDKHQNLMLFRLILACNYVWLLSISTFPSLMWIFTCYEGTWFKGLKLSINSHKLVPFSLTWLR